ncbi:MAG: pilus assembly protein PilM [Nitrospirae bacterium]|nr:pilus assembly protein PilM [Nitrospirota bacterium]
MDKRSKITSLVLDAAWRAGKIARPLTNILLFSAADEHVSFKKEFCLSLEKGGVSFAYGTRFLSSISIKETKHYPVAEHGDYPQPKEVASLVMLAIKEMGISAGSLTLSIPKAWAVVKTAEFPATVRENLPDVVTYELDRLVPFSAESASYDFMVIGETAEKITIVVAAARTDVIKSYSDAISESGMTVTGVTLNIFSMAELCRKAGGKKDFLFAGIDGSEYEGALFMDGRPCGVVSERFVETGDSSRAGTITSGLKLLVDAARKRDGSLRPPLFMTGGSSALVERLKNSLGLSVSLLDGYFASPDSRSAAVGGVMESLRPGARRLELLSRGRHEAPAAPWVLSIILVLLLLSCWALYLVAPIQLERKKMAEIERQIKLRRSSMKDLDTLSKDIDTAKNQVETVANFKEGSPTALAIIKELTTVLPKSAWLTRVRTTRSTVEIEGYSPSASELLSRLEASKYLTKAEFSSPTFRDVRMNSDRFSIKMEIRGVKDGKGVQQKNEKK